ncbi:MAG: hypothetical protein SNJ54_08635 [Anaerolineae bacterium]
MAIDYLIQYPCTPRAELGDETILDLLKEQERAQMIIHAYRASGDNRPPSEMGFEFTRRTPEGEEGTQLIVVQDVLDRVEQLKALEHHCAQCPANRLGKPYGCAGFIEYPISAAGETWLLNRLPSLKEPLLWLLLKQGVDEFMYDGQDIAKLRAASDAYFEARPAPSRRLGEFDIDGNQAFEMIFNVGTIQPNHAGVLLLFFHAIPRDLEADAIIRIGEADYRAYPFLIEPERTDDATIDELKAFFNALYVAWALKVPLFVAP